ncbi:hypothetical protein BD324DRAFT_623342 [Kockovaella imperatae]|uniref:SAP domain-containing protein n=1 Tax=Kockovaella imperatae TaxID=4999 RepID=A0A1Y1UKZ9_9TREE|nr:hypothetical protein BD324DRAFT_623342 [Kockovaella imperatae]ORX37795.1 hypothetical protein BD324DRAFT_623342 [Kockovaella imperatae]
MSDGASTDLPRISTEVSDEHLEVPEAGPSRPKKKSTVEEMRADLAKLGLDTRGRKQTLWKRLVKAFQQALQLLDEESISEGHDGDIEPETSTREAHDRARAEKWKAFLCFDVEATCRGGKKFNWPNEIIEFPIVLLKWASDPSISSSSHPGKVATEPPTIGKRRRLAKVDTFHSYLKPIWQPQLTDFCTTLTGITQETVDRSPTFLEMLPSLEAWLNKHDLLDEDGRLKDAMWVTDGPWDLRDFIPKQLHISPPSSGHPLYFSAPYLNIKQATQTVLTELFLRDEYSRTHPGFTDHNAKRGVITTAQRISHKTKARWTGPDYYFTIPGQLEAFGLGTFDGRQHSGIDDATNISRILIAISERDVIIEPNARAVHPNHGKKWPWMGPPGVVKWEEWMTDNEDRLATMALPANGQKRATKPETRLVLKENANGQLISIKLPVNVSGAGDNPAVTRVDDEKVAKSDRPAQTPDATIMGGKRGGVPDGNQEENRLGGIWRGCLEQSLN